MATEIIFDPLLPIALIWAARAVGVLATGLALWRGLAGWWLRFFAFTALLAAVLNPSVQTEERETLKILPPSK